MKISISAKSSSGDPYTVDFIREDGLLSVFCDCPAGEWGKFCKHKWRLLSGDRTMLEVKSDEEKLLQVEVWAKESSFMSLYDEVNELEMESEQLKARIKKAKKDVEMKMKEGF